MCFCGAAALAPRLKSKAPFRQPLCVQHVQLSNTLSMSAQATVRRNKTSIQLTLSSDYKLILNKVHQRNLITLREYNNLKSINKEDVEGHVIELVDKMVNKGEGTCQAFLNLLQTDEEIQSTYPLLKNIGFNEVCLSTRPIQEICSVDRDYHPKESKRRKQEEQYQLLNRPVGLCVIINNVNFMDGTTRAGSDKDAGSLAEVFSWLGFRVLLCKDQTEEQMVRLLKCFSCLSDLSQLQEFDVKEFYRGGFTHVQESPAHGDAFVCCILSHGGKGVVYGVDSKPLSIREITGIFKSTDNSTLTGKPKVFLIQACQGSRKHRGVLLQELEADDCLISIPEEADLLVALATVEDYQAMRDTKNGSWFVQSVCHQLKEGCPRGEDIASILYRVNDEVSLKEGSRQHGAVKQMPEFRFTLRKRLVLSPHHI